MLGNSRTLVGLVAILSALANRLALSDLIESNMRELSHGLLEFGKIKDGERLDPIDYFIEDLFPKFINQRPNNENGTMLQWKDYAMTDESNDDALWLSGQELITRSGFKYELYDSIADDGYITQLIRIINPKADRSRLRQPPVLMEHGGTIDPTAYLVASTIQHFPEPWPRMPEDGPIRSWNRSLALVLANNGFDVWLAETRGANDRNRRRVASHAAETILKGKNEDMNMTLGENIVEFFKMRDFWAYDQDDLIAHELKSHMDTVLNVTGSEKVHLMTYSLSTPSSLAFLSIRPDYAEKIQGYISMAPIISGEGVSRLIKLIFQYYCPTVPDAVGNFLVTNTLLTDPVRRLMITLARDKHFRYSITKGLTTLLMGASAKYRTLIDLNILGHLLRRVGFRELKQMCQQMRSNKLQKFDYGSIGNRLIYKQAEPPIYDLSNLNIRDWIIVSAANDALSTPEVIDHLIEIVNPKPIAHICAPQFNHADLFAGWENDIYINLPILHYLEKMSYDPSRSKEQRSVKTRGLDLGPLLANLNPVKVMTESAVNYTKAVTPVSPFDIERIMEIFTRNVQTIIKTFIPRISTEDNAKSTYNDSKSSNRDDIGTSLNIEKNLNGLMNIDSINNGFSALTKSVDSVDIENPMKFMGNLRDLLRPRTSESKSNYS